jgi:hypothetical protein
MRGKATKINNAHMERYKLPIVYGREKMEEKRIIDPMQHIAKFMEHWTIIDPTAKFTIINGEFKTDNTHIIRMQ